MNTINDIFDCFESFNSRELKSAGDELVEHFNSGNSIMVTIAGALSTAGIGKSLSGLIKNGKISAITSTAANLEEDILRVFTGKYQKVDWRELKPEEEMAFYKRDELRVTDTLLDGGTFNELAEEFILIVESLQNPIFPHEAVYLLLEKLIKEGRIDENRLAKESWVYNCYKTKTPIYVPGFEDCTFSNYLIAKHLAGNKKINTNNIKSGLEYMKHLALFYIQKSTQHDLGFLQLGGGIAGDFSICVVPMLTLMSKKETKRWKYFCQISESTTSFGSYSGAPPNEKISWGKLNLESKSFMIESDATIVAPILLKYVENNLKYD